MLLSLCLLVLAPAAGGCSGAKPLPTHPRFVPIPAPYKHLCVLDLELGAIVRGMSIDPCTDDVQVSPDGRWIALSDESGVVRIASMDSSVETRSIAFAFDAGWSSFTLAWAPDSSRVAVLESHRCLHLVDTRSMEARTIELQALPTCVLWSPRGDRIAVGMEPRSVEIVDPTGVLASNFVPYTQGVFYDCITALAFTPDGDVLAAGSSDGWVEIRSLSQQRGLARFRLGPSWAFGYFQVTSLSFSPDGHSLIGSTNDLWCVDEWDWERGKRLWTLHQDWGNPRPLRAAYSADGSWIHLNHNGDIVCSGDPPRCDPFGSEWVTSIDPVPGDRFSVAFTLLGAVVFDTRSHTRSYSVIGGSVVR